MAGKHTLRQVKSVLACSKQEALFFLSRDGVDNDAARAIEIGGLHPHAWALSLDLEKRKVHIEHPLVTESTATENPACHACGAASSHNFWFYGVFNGRWRNSYRFSHKQWAQYFGEHKDHIRCWRMYCDRCNKLHNEKDVFCSRLTKCFRSHGGITTCSALRRAGVVLGDEPVAAVAAVPSRKKKKKRQAASRAWSEKRAAMRATLVARARKLFDKYLPKAKAGGDAGDPAYVAWETNARQQLWWCHRYRSWDVTLSIFQMEQLTKAGLVALEPPLLASVTPPEPAATRKVQDEDSEPEPTTVTGRSKPRKRRARTPKNTASKTTKAAAAAIATPVPKKTKAAPAAVPEKWLFKAGDRVLRGTDRATVKSRVEGFACRVYKIKFDNGTMANSSQSRLSPDIEPVKAAKPAAAEAWLYKAGDRVRRGKDAATIKSRVEGFALCVYKIKFDSGLTATSTQARLCTL